MLPQGIEGEKDAYEEYADECFAVGYRYMACKTQEEYRQCEIGSIGYEITECGSVHTIERNEAVVEQDRDGSKEEGKEEGEYIEAGVTECRETNREGGNYDLVDTEDQDYILRHSVCAAVGQDMEYKVDIEPYSQEYESSDEQEVVAHLMDETGCFFSVLLLDSPCQLRRGDGGKRAVWDTDHDGDICSDGVYTGVVKSHFCSNKKGGQCGCQYTCDGRYEEEGCIEEVVAYEFGVLAEERPVGLQRYMSARKDVGEIDECGDCIVEA